MYSPTTNLTIAQTTHMTPSIMTHTHTLSTYTKHTHMLALVQITDMGMAIHCGSRGDVTNNVQALVDIDFIASPHNDINNSNNTSTAPKSEPSVTYTNPHLFTPSVLWELQEEETDMFVHR